MIPRDTTSFLRTSSFPGWKIKLWWERKLLVFQQDNAPAHKSRYTQSWLMDHDFKEGRLMVSPNSPDLNPIKNLWAIIKWRIYADGRQFNTLDALWNAVVDACRSIKPCEVRKLTSAIDKRLLKILKNGGGYVYL